jgi:hypothetical protein
MSGIRYHEIKGKESEFSAEIRLQFKKGDFDALLDNIRLTLPS